MSIDISISIQQPDLVPRDYKPSGDHVDYTDSRNMSKPTNTEFKKHTVMAGEKLEDIAELYDISSTQLAEFLREEYGTDMIYEGKDIKIPTIIERI